MLNIKELLQESKTKYLQSFYNNRIRIRMDRPIISISFDDAPRSAMTNGVPILDKFSVAATFYISMGLAKRVNSDSTKNNNYGLECLSPSEILELNCCGHDISCHSYSHYMLCNGTAQGLALDAQRNVRELRTLLNCESIDHFSYPFGNVSLKAKKHLAKSYKTMRSSRPGINQLATDLYLLRAISIYNTTFNKSKIIRLIKKAESSGGWLIFYTHGVTNDPDAYSCTPEQLEWLIKQCKLSRAHVLPISAAYTKIFSSAF